MARIELVFTDPATEKSMEQRAAWLGLSKEQYMQYLVDGQDVPITAAILRRQVRWLARHLERMADDITPENRDPGPKMGQWYQRFGEVFDLPTGWPSMEEQFRKLIDADKKKPPPPGGWDDSKPIRIIITPPED